MNDLEKYFINNKKRIIFKSPHCLKLYDEHFSRFRGTDVHIMEVGLDHGGCLQMWKDYFGVNAVVYGVDYNNFKKYEENQITVFQGKQENREFWKDLKNKIKRIDILIDDCSHICAHQKIMFEEMYSFISFNGIYACEDIHTSYREPFGGGLKNPNSFVEFSKNLIDELHMREWRDKNQYNSEFCRTTKGIYFYNSLLIIEKGKDWISSPIKTGAGVI